MAMSATISVSSSTMALEQQAIATITVSNSGAAPVLILACKLTTNLTGNPAPLDKTSFAAGTVPLSAGFPTSVPASGTLVFRVPIVYFETSRSTTFDVVAHLQSNDGSRFQTASPATITITSIPGIPSTYAGPPGQQ